MIAKLARARQRARKYTEALYDGICTVKGYSEIRAPTGEDIKEPVEIYTDIPCRLSHDSSPAASDATTADTISQGITMFMAPEYVVEPGSVFVVTQNGVTREYKNSGPAKVYTTHQEISLELMEDYV